MCILQNMSDSYLYWEDFVPGAVINCGPKTITHEEIIEFAEEFNPQPMHLDEKIASNSMLEGLAASGTPVPSSCRCCARDIFKTPVLWVLPVLMR